LLQRSYRKELFDDAISRMRRARIKTEQEIEKFRKLQEKIEDLVREKHSAETDYGEIPEEFKGSDHVVTSVYVLHSLYLKHSDKLAWTAF